MNRSEALRILGLDEDASLDDIKTAYKEMVQILHPDRYTANKKLQDRATEQFKTLQEAYDYLSKGKGKKGAGSNSSSSRSRSYSAESEYEARLAGIAAARAQLVAQRDAAYDERKIGLTIGFAGLALVILFRRFPPILAFGTTAVVFGVVRFMSVQATLNNLSKHISDLNKEKKRILSDLETYKNK